MLIILGINTNVFSTTFSLNISSLFFMNPSLAITITLYSRFSTSSLITPKTLFISIESTTLSKSSGSSLI